MRELRVSGVAPPANAAARFTAVREHGLCRMRSTSERMWSTVGKAFAIGFLLYCVRAAFKFTIHCWSYTVYTSRLLKPSDTISNTGYGMPASVMQRRSWL